MKYYLPGAYTPMPTPLSAQNSSILKEIVPGDMIVPHQVLRPEIMGMVEDALGRLRSVEQGDPIASDTIYRQEQLPGLGKNFCVSEFVSKPLKPTKPY